MSFAGYVLATGRNMVQIQEVSTSAISIVRTLRNSIMSRTEQRPR